MEFSWTYSGINSEMGMEYQSFMLVEIDHKIEQKLDLEAVVHEAARYTELSHCKLGVI